MEKHLSVERSIITTYKTKIWKPFISAIKTYNLVEDGDRIAVCISGGKDSTLLAKCFQELKKHGKNNFETVYLVMNPGYNDINLQTILNNAELLNIPITVFNSEIYDIVENVGGSPCYLCARMRRGHLYSKAKELGCNKIALGHHFDDVIETTMLSMLYNGQFKTMLPKLKSKNFEGMELIRPLYLVKENDIINWKNYNGLSFINCACRFTEKCNVCDVKEGGGSKRAEMKKIIRYLREINPIFDHNIYKSLGNVKLDTVLSYEKDGKVFSFLDNYNDISDAE